MQSTIWESIYLFCLWELGKAPERIKYSPWVFKYNRNLAIRKWVESLLVVKDMCPGRGKMLLGH